LNLKYETLLNPKNHRHTIAINESFAMKESSRKRVSKSKQPIYARKGERVGIFYRERNDMKIIKSGETCHVSGTYKAHCVHALERSFSKGQKLPRCERCQFDILWVLLR
jgi:hypothetical protein